MNTRHFPLKHLVLAAAAALPFAAQAEPTIYTTPGYEHLSGSVTPAGQGKTRAQVRMELEEFQRNPVSHDGWLQEGPATFYVGTPNTAGGKTRAEVLMELEEFRRNPVSADGWLQDGPATFYVGVPVKAGKSRAQVRGDVLGWSGPANDDMISGHATVRQ